MRTKGLTSLLLVTLFCIAAKGQGNASVYLNKYPFNLKQLEELASHMDRNDTLKPFFNKWKCSFFNTAAGINQDHEQYDEAYPYCGNYAVVKKLARYGIINRRGQILAYTFFKDFKYNKDPEGILFYPSGRLFTFADGRLADDEDDDVPERFKALVIKRRTKPAIVAKKQPIKEQKWIGRYKPLQYITHNQIAAVINGKFGVINPDGKILIPFEFTQFCGASDSINAGYYAMKKGTEWYYYHGLKLLFKCPKTPLDFSPNKLIFKTNDLVNAFDDNGNIVLPKNYKWLSAKSWIALNTANEIVLLDSNNKEFVYYKP